MTLGSSYSRILRTAVIFGLTFAACLAQAAPPSSLREVSNFNREWKFQLGDAVADSGLAVAAIVRSNDNPSEPFCATIEL